MNKIINIKTKYIDYPCTVEFGEYRNGQISISLFDAETGEPAAKATSCMEGIVNIDWKSKNSHFKGKTAIKDYSENEGMFGALIKAGIIEPTGETIETDYVTFPIVRVIQ